MSIKLVLCDLDGTLLNSQKTISEQNKKAFNCLKKQGILTGFCTSRGRPNVLEYENFIQPDILICNGGGSIFYKNELASTNTFSLEETRTLLKTAKEVCGPNCEITLDTLNKLYWNRHHDKSTDYAPDSIFTDFEDFRENALKICVQTQDKSKAEKIAKSIPECDYLPFSDIPWFKFSNKNAVKEKAIEFLCGYIKISTSEIAAFGDDFNDIGMLKMCGTGVAMQNAIPEVKQACKYTTLSNDEDGVAAFIFQNILN